MVEAVRRVVTGHQSDAEVVLLKADDVPFQAVPGAPGMQVALVWTTGAVPANNVGDVEGEARSQGAGLKKGSALWVTEFEPDFESPMHRTFSIDYGVVLSGVLELGLDGGERVRLGAGDMIVQRGTSHLWRNPSTDEPCRFVMSMIEARPIELGGTILSDTLN